MRNKTTREEYLRAGELARLAGVSTDTLRHYERKGLLARPRRSANDYREYPAAALDRVRLVRAALAVGFTLDELARILEVRDRGGAPCHQVRAMAGTKLSEVESQIGELTALRDELRGLLKSWDGLLENTSPPGRANLLESLATSGFQRRRRPGLLAQTPITRKKASKETQW